MDRPSSPSGSLDSTSKRARKKRTSASEKKKKKNKAKQARQARRKEREGLMLLALRGPVPAATSPGTRSSEADEDVDMFTTPLERSSSKDGRTERKNRTPKRQQPPAAEAAEEAAAPHRSTVKKARVDGGPSAERGAGTGIDRRIESDGGWGGGVHLPRFDGIEYGDHFETSAESYADVRAVLQFIAEKLGKGEEELVVYDPYYCAGSVVRRLGALGFGYVINRERDFYADVRAGAVPEYDVLVTNPPYSGDHRERALRFCMESGKPWLMLLPNYCAVKKFYRALVAETGSSMEPFFVVPDPSRPHYQFDHPEGTGHDKPPFASFWFVHLGRNHKKKALQEVRERTAAMRRRCLVLQYQDLSRRKLVPVGYRPNPKQRRKLKEQRKKAVQ